MKNICTFLFLILLTSCEYFNVKKTSSSEILNEELQSFKWNEVDTFPTFTSCNASTSKTESKQCFERVLTTYISTFLLNEQIVVSQDVRDTIVLQFQVSETGNLDLLKTKVSNKTLEEIPNIKDLLKQSLAAVPKIFPALKRGQQVKTEFTLPIIINVN